MKVCDYESAKQFVEENSFATLISKEYRNQKEKMDFICKCGKPFSTPMDAFIRHSVRQCNKCGYSNGGKKNSRTHEEFVLMASQLIGDEFEIIDGEYKNQNSVFTIYHKVCKNTFPRTAQKILSCKNECGCCGSNVKRTKGQVQEEINSFSKEIEVIEYINSDKVIVMHTTCKTVVKRTMSDLRKNRGFHCPTCKSSYGTREVVRVLNENNIKFKREHEFDDCRNKKPLPFDFYLINYNACVEFDGEHHDRVLFHWGKQEQFELVQKRDGIKNDYCKKNNIPLLRIKYKHQDDIELILLKFINKLTPR